MYITEKIDRYLKKGRVCESILNENNAFGDRVIRDIKRELGQGKTTVAEVLEAIGKLPVQQQQQFSDAFSDYFSATKDTDKGLTDLYGMLS